MICTKCGESNPDASVFCGGCGSTLMPMPQSSPSAPVFPGQMPPSASPFGSNVPMQAAMPVNEEGPTLRAEQLVFPQQPQVPLQPTPSANEFFNYGTPAPQGMPGQATPPPAPGFSSGATYPGQAQAAPGYPIGAGYPGQMPAAPGFPSG